MCSRAHPQTLLNKGVGVFDHERSCLRQRELWPNQHVALGIEPFVIHEPEVVTLTEMIANARVDARLIVSTVVLQERAYRKVDVEGGLNLQPRQVRVESLVAVGKTNEIQKVFTAQLKIAR